LGSSRRCLHSSHTCTSRLRRMLVKIKKLDSSTEDITVEEKDLVATLKEKLAEQAGLHKDQVRLILKGQPLLDDKVIILLNFFDFICLWSSSSTLAVNGRLQSEGW